MTWTIEYTAWGVTFRQGRYADKAMADMNARLNAHLSAVVVPSYYS
jgi:hypothetical protein